MHGWTLRTSLGAMALTLAVLAGGASRVHAQTITGISTYTVVRSGPGTGNTGGPAGRYTNTQGGDFPSNTFITRGSNPETDAFVTSNANAPGSVIPGGLALALGTNVFYLWGFTGIGDESGVSLMFGANLPTSAPTLSSYYVDAATTQNASGRTAFNDFSVPTVAGPLSAILGGFQVTITDFRQAFVTRNVGINPGNTFETSTPIRNSVGRLVLEVTDPNAAPPGSNVVPEPSTYLLMATGLAGLAVVARRRQQRA